ncbi:MAG: hypothetical protein AAF687_06835, partial [Pseudomonadota bacterium]
MNIRVAKTPAIRLLAAALAAATVATSPVPALAQDQVSEARLRKIEAEIRALQRNVFPDGAGRIFQPEISQGETRTATSTNPASTTAVTDILARLDAIELQLQRLTAASEVNGNALSEMEARVATLESNAALAASAAAEEESATDSNLAAMTGGGADAAEGEEAAEGEAATGPSAERIAAVQAITKPQTDDAGDDDYSYGFRLWNAKFY